MESNGVFVVVWRVDSFSKAFMKTEVQKKKGKESSNRLLLTKRYLQSQQNNL